MIIGVNYALLTAAYIIFLADLFDDMKEPPSENRIFDT
jgi:hypothetical protein